jgi:hypothetical protein
MKNDCIREILRYLYGKRFGLNIVMSSSFLLVQAIFETKMFPINTPTLFKPTRSSYLPASEDGTECSETLPYTHQMLENYPEESIQEGNILT